MSMCASSIKSNPAHRPCARLQLRAISAVYPHSLSPLWHSSQVGLLPGQLLVRRNVTEHLSCGVVLHPDDEVRGFCPKRLWQSGLDQACTDVFHDVPVERFCDSIVLRCVMHGKPVLCTLLHKVLGELVSSVLASTVQPQSLDPHTVLRVYPCGICFICFECLILHAEHGQR